MKTLILSITLVGLFSSVSYALDPYILNLQRSAIFKEENVDYKKEINKIAPSVDHPTKRLNDMKMYAALVHPTNYASQHTFLKELLRDDYFMQNSHRFMRPYNVPEEVFLAIVKEAKSLTWRNNLGFMKNQSRGLHFKLNHLCRELDAYRELLERKVKPVKSGSYSEQLISLLELP